MTRSGVDVALVSVAVAVGAMLLTSCDPQPDPSSWAWADIPNDRIVFVSKATDPYGNPEIYLLTQEGDLTQVLDGTDLNGNPSISADGRRVAFHRWLNPEDFNSLELFMVDVATGTETRLTADGYFTTIPKWNDDGTRLVYSSGRTYDAPSEANVFILDIADWSVTQVASEPDHEDNDPAWCGDDAIVFKSNRHTGEKYKEEIHLASLDGEDVTRLTTTTGWESDHDPRCSPDGEWVYFYRYEATRPWTEFTAEAWDEIYPVNIWRVDTNGNQEKLTDCEYACGNPVPADDGRVAYIEKEFILDDDGVLIGSTARLMVMEADGSDPQELLPPNVYAEHVSTLEWFDW